MLIKFLNSGLLVLFCLVSLEGESVGWTDDCVDFDLPSVVAAYELVPADPTLPPLSSQGSVLQSDVEHRLVRIEIPCSTLVNCRDPRRVMQLMVQVRGLSVGMQVADYQPRTQLYSEIDGPISIESHDEKNMSIGVDATGAANDLLKIKATAGAGTTKGVTQRYQKIPEQKLLLASGTLNRSTGVYYKFRHSNQTTLEGGHQLAITFRVPATWRGGLLRIDCRATGVQKYLLGKDDDYPAGMRSFVVAAFLNGDVQARQIAQQYAQWESQIRNYARAWVRQQQRRSHRDPVLQLGELLGYEYESSQLPQNWSENFMLYDSRSIQTRIRPHLSKSLQRATDQYVLARHRVLKLTR